MPRIINFARAYSWDWGVWLTRLLVDQTPSPALDVLHHQRGEGRGQCSTSSACWKGAVWSTRLRTCMLELACTSREAPRFFKALKQKVFRRQQLTRSFSLSGGVTLYVRTICWCSPLPQRRPRIAIRERYLSS